MLHPRNQAPFRYLPQEHGFAIPGSPAESDMLYGHYARSRGLQPGSPEERDFFSSSKRSRSPGLRRSARIQQQALHADDQMPGLISPPESPSDSPTAPALIPMRGYPSWPRWYDSLSPHFALQAPETSAEHPGMNCVERALLQGALSASQRCDNAAGQRALFLHLIRDAWMAAILCRNATKDPEL